MSKKSHCSKTPAPIVPDETLEEKMRQAADNPPAPAPSTSLAMTEDVRIEKIKHPQGERQLARARSGKFIARTEANAIVAAKRTQDFLQEVDPKTVTETEPGISRDEVLRNSLYEGAVTAAAIAKTLGNSVKAVELLDRMSGREKVREEALTNRDNIQSHIPVVHIHMPVLMNPTVYDYDEELRKRKERDAKGPGFLDAEFKTDPPKV